MRSSDLFPGSGEWLHYVVGGAAGLIFLAGLVGLTTTRSGRGSEAVGEPSNGGQPAPKLRLFVPKTTSEGGSTVMPVRFPDGSTAEILYDPALKLAELGLFFDGSVQLQGGPHRRLIVEYGERGTFYEGEAPTAQLPGAEGTTVGVWRGADGDPASYLVFRFGSWTVGISEGEGKEKLNAVHLSEFASKLAGAETPDGFLVLEARSPLKLEPPGGTAGPTIEIGTIRSKGILLLPGPCVAPSGAGVETHNGVAVRRQKLLGKFHFARLCIPEASFAAQAYGDESFVRSVAQSLRIRGVVLASPGG